MRATCTESRRTIRNWAVRRQIITYADDKDHDSAIAHLEVKPLHRAAVDVEGRVWLTRLGWNQRATLNRQRRAERELELDKPVYLGTSVAQLAKLLHEGKLRPAS